MDHTDIPTEESAETTNNDNPPTDAATNGDIPTEEKEGVATES
jgi:hypothetical protein